MARMRPPDLRNIGVLNLTGVRLILLALFATLLWPSPSGANPAASARKVRFEEVRIPNGDEPPLIAGIWYPPPEPSRSGLRGAPPSEARGMPLVVISHGGGGSYAGHEDTAIALVRAGFVTAAVTHAGDSSDDQSKVLMLWRRPAQLSRLIDFVLHDWRGHAVVDADRVGAFGFSNGGFTVLVAAGGIPDLLKIDPYCFAHPTHDLCQALRSANVHSVAAIVPPPGAWRPDPRIRAVAAAAPAFGFTFDGAGLAEVEVPVQLWRAADDLHQPHPWYEEAIRNALPRAPDYRVVPNASHYAFLPPCSAAKRPSVPEICRDRRGFDRAKFHRRFNAGLIAFFRRTLR